MSYGRAFDPAALEAAKRLTAKLNAFPRPPAPSPDMSREHRISAAHNRITRRFRDAGVEGIERFARILESLSNRDLDAVARFAEGLAEWPLDTVGSPDGAQ